MDIYIPSIKVSIEYDGAIFSHTTYSDHNLLKAKHINNCSNICKHITVLEDGCLRYGDSFSKFKYYSLSTVSGSYSREYIISLKFTIIAILKELGIIKPDVSLSVSDLNVIYERRANFYE